MVEVEYFCVVDCWVVECVVWCVIDVDGFFVDGDWFWDVLVCCVCELFLFVCCCVGGVDVFVLVGEVDGVVGDCWIWLYYVVGFVGLFDFVGWLW